LRSRRFLFAGCGLLLALSTGAAGDDPPKLLAPYASVSVRSPERLQQISRFAFDAILRPDLTDATRKAVIEESLNVQTLQGLDLSRPCGQMLVFRLPLPGSDRQAVGEEAEFDFEAILEDAEILLFGSITDRQAAKDLLNGAMTRTTRLRPVEGMPELFQAVDSEDDAVAFAVRLFTTGEAYLEAQGGVRALLEIPAMEARPDALALRHDCLATFQMQHTPAALRRRFSEHLWRHAAPGLQQRDEEPADEFALRDATQRSLVELVDLAASGLGDISFSGDLQEAERRLRLRLEINAVEGSELEKRLTGFDAPPSMFLRLHDPDAAASLVVSVQLSDFEQKLLSRWVRWLRACSDANSDPSGEEERMLAAFRQSYDALQGMIDHGHIDLFARLEIEESGALGVVGGVRLAEPAALGAALKMFGDYAVENLRKEPVDGQTYEMTASRGLTLHHFRDRDSLTTAAGQPRDLNICGGVGRGALWFAWGSFNSVERLEELLDQMDAATRNPQSARLAPPILLTASAAKWQRLPMQDDFDAGLRRSLREEAFARDDRAEFELRPTQHGLRFEGRLELGFLRWAALLIAKGQDESQL
jgi:hypothetical protein